MLCENCNKNEATVYYTEIVNGNYSEKHLCQECSSGAGITSFGSHSIFMNQESPLSSLLSTILGFSNDYTETKPQTQKDVVCETCGMTYQEFLKTGKFGCSNCINTFGTGLDSSFRRIHGSDIHTGKRPINYRDESPNTEGINVDSKQDQANDAQVKQGQTNVGQFKNTTKENNNTQAGNEKISDINRLQDKLNQAVKAEEYEEAAKIRDAIRDLKKKNEEKAEAEAKDVDKVNNDKTEADDKTEAKDEGKGVTGN